MTLQAFHDDAERKAQLVEPLRSRWSARTLIPASILKWDPETNINSLCGAMVASQDRDEFVSRTGIPVEMAMLCEALIGADLEVVPAPDTPAGFAMHCPDALFAFGMEWLDAIRPGADLSEVVPRFMATLLAKVADPGFDLASHVEPAVRTAAADIAALWQRELDGGTVASAEWAKARKAAVAASESCRDPWCYPIAGMVESLAWPVHSIAPEFVSYFRGFEATWLSYLQQPFLSEQDRADKVHELVGWMHIARSASAADEEQDVPKLLDAFPESKRVLLQGRDAAAKERIRTAKLQACVVTVPAVRAQMNQVLDLIRSA